MTLQNDIRQQTADSTASEVAAGNPSLPYSAKKLPSSTMGMA